ncbi:MAG: 50S ribosomal protein L32 [bacterium]|nr:50S ribosomal protein L32 [bacterium]
MPPVPKRKHSTSRKGKRRAALKISLPPTARCSHCKSPKHTHQACPTCGR